MTRDHALIMDSASSVVISDVDGPELDDNACTGAYVEVIGTLDLIPALGYYGVATVESITLVMDQESTRDSLCWSRHE